MKYLLSLTFLLIAITAFGQSDTTNIKPKTKKGYYKSKAKSRPKPIQKFGWNATLINHQDLTKTQKKKEVFTVENQTFIYIDSVLHKVDFKDRIYQIADEMPMFPACDSLTDYTERKSCADKAMLDFIYANLQKPKNCAREGGVEGTVVISFVVKKDGSISDAKIIREVGCGCGDEALRVVNSMPKWIPGRQRNQAVDVQFNLPIRFRLE